METDPAKGLENCLASIQEEETRARKLLSEKRAALRTAKNEFWEAQRALETITATKRTLENANTIDVNGKLVLEVGVRYIFLLASCKGRYFFLEGAFVEVRGDWIALKNTCTYSVSHYDKDHKPVPDRSFARLSDRRGVSRGLLHHRPEKV